MNSLLSLRNCQKLLIAFRRLCEAMPKLIEMSGLKHREIYEHPELAIAGIKIRKDTFYRRLQTHNWTFEELSIILPLVIDRLKKNNPSFYKSFRLTLEPVKVSPPEAE